MQLKKFEPIFRSLDLSEDLKQWEKEITLWRAVLDQAFFDAFCSPTDEYGDLVKAEARAWLFGGSEDFNFIVDCAGLDYKFVCDIRDRFLHYDAIYQVAPILAREYWKEQNDEDTTSP